jgi:hypothetical protein
MRWKVSALVKFGEMLNVLAKGRKVWLYQSALGVSKKLYLLNRPTLLLKRWYVPARTVSVQLFEVKRRRAAG